MAAATAPASAAAPGRGDPPTDHHRAVLHVPFPAGPPQPPALEVERGAEPGPGAAHLLEPSPAPPAAENSRRQGSSVEEHARLRALMDAPFTAEEAIELAKRTPLRKSVVGPLAPWLLRPAHAQLAPLIAAEFNSWRRAGRLPCSDARSYISPIPKAGGAPTSPADLRGIAVGALLAKLYAMGLERRVSDHAEAAGVHAEGQFGFRRQRSTEQAIFALRTIIECHRLQRQRGGSSQRQLWACFVDFKQAYDRVPRELLWTKLALMGYDGEWLHAVQAIYTEVPMSVSVPGIQHRVFQATQGLKQGCPLSPTLFSLYIDDFEQRILAAALRGEQLDLPSMGGRLVPPLLYADDMALLATSAAGLQAQLRLLEAYCQEWGLTVNVTKTKIVLLAGGSSATEAMAQAERARIRYQGSPVPVASEFKYLGVVFHCSTTLGESAAPGRAAVARFAAAEFEARCSQLGIEAARLLLLLFHSLVDSTLSYAAAVWAPGLAAAAAVRPVVGGAAGASSSPSAAEMQHHRFLRRLLGLPARTPIPVLLAEAGEMPLYVRWLMSAARFWNSLLEAAEGSLMQQALKASLDLAASHTSLRPAKQPWAAQLAFAMQRAGVQFDPQLLQPLSLDDVQREAMARHLQRVTTAAAAGGGRMQHYFVRVRPDCLSWDSYGMPAYLVEVRELRCRRALTELRTGLHWGREETDRLRAGGPAPRTQRTCLHCGGGTDDVEHILFDCSLYAAERARWPELTAQRVSLHALFAQPGGMQPLAQFAAACRRRGREANGLPP